MEIRVTPHGPVEQITVDTAFSDTFVEAVDNVDEHLAAERERKEGEMGKQLIAYLREHPLAIVRFDDWVTGPKFGSVNRELAHLYIYPLADMRRVGE